MLYRKVPPSPPRLLLRIVATAGTSALLGAAACSSTSSGPIAIMPGDDASNAVMGFGAYPCYIDASACVEAGSTPSCRPAPTLRAPSPTPTMAGHATAVLAGP